MKVERTHHIESLTVSEVQGAGWLVAMDLTREEEQRSAFITIKVCPVLQASYRGKGSQASAPLPGCRITETPRPT